MPVWQLLGGKVPDRLKVYGWIGGDKPADVHAQAEQRAAQGFAAVKMNGTGTRFPLPAVLTLTYRRDGGLDRLARGAARRGGARARGARDRARRRRRLPWRSCSRGSSDRSSRSSSKARTVFP